MSVAGASAFVPRQRGLDIAWRCDQTLKDIGPQRRFSILLKGFWNEFAASQFSGFDSSVGFKFTTQPKGGGDGAGCREGAAADH